MTVAELIEKLQAVEDKNMPVVIQCGEFFNDEDNIITAESAYGRDIPCFRIVDEDWRP